VTEELFEFNLRAQVKPLVELYFPHIKKMNKIPMLKIQRFGDEDYEDVPARLNALTGVISIDERVATFQDKTTKILILHELIHWSLYLHNKDPDNDEKDRFQSELTRIKKLGAYTGLL
jgi:hypothetical protein